MPARAVAARLPSMSRARAAGWARRTASWGAMGVLLAGVALPLLPTSAAEFRRLRAEQIRARIAGRDITDDFHWTEYYQRDGVLVLTDMGRRRDGRWKIERDMLCLARGPGAAFDCFQVWVAGDEVSLRAHDADQPQTAFIRRHE